jgi:hypothetical protein
MVDKKAETRPFFVSIARQRSIQGIAEPIRYDTGGNNRKEKKRQIAANQPNGYNPRAKKS